MLHATFPGVIDKQLLARSVVLSHDHVQLAPPGAITLAEPTVLVAVWMGGPVFLPEQKQRAALALGIPVDVYQSIPQEIAPVERRSRLTLRQAKSWEGG